MSQSLSVVDYIRRDTKLAARRTQRVHERTRDTGNLSVVTQAVVYPTANARPQTVWRRFATELVATLWTPLRLLLRHWPVLFTLCVAGAFVRAGFIRASIWAAGINAYFGFLVFLLAPVSMMVAMVLMLRAVRPSLPAARELSRAGSLLRDTGSVLIPFVAFYLAYGQFQEDYRDYDEQLRNTYESVGAYFFHTDQQDVRVPLLTEPGTNVVPLLAVVAVAFALRWALNRWKLTRRLPVLGLPGAYLESIWVIMGGLFVIKQLVDGAESWAGERTAWHAVLDWWHGVVGVGGQLAPLYHTVDDWLVGAFPSGAVTNVFFVPITGLVAASVVYNVTVSDVTRPWEPRGQQGWIRWAGSGLAFAINRRFQPLVQGSRAMARAGVVPIMFFCLSVVVLETGAQWLRKAEWALVGPYDLRSVQSGLNASVEGFNDVLIFVLLVCLLAAAVDGVARRNRGPAPVSAPGEPDVTGHGDEVVDADGDGLGISR